MARAEERSSTKVAADIKTFRRKALSGVKGPIIPMSSCWGLNRLTLLT